MLLMLMPHAKRPEMFFLLSHADEELNVFVQDLWVFFGKNTFALNVP